MNNLQAIAGSVARQSPPPTTDPAVGRAGTGILSQEQFDRYAANWLEVIYNADGRALHESFLGANQEKVNALTFPLQSIVELVSAVGVQHIKARFLIQTDESGAAPHFTLALFAADALGKRLSSYYVADTHWLGESAATAPLLAPTAAPSTVGHQIANVLAHKWAQNWATTPQIETAMFDNAYGPMNGYTFEVGDFMAPLFKLTSLDDASKLQVNFCLHEFSRPTADGGDRRAMTFALTVQVVTKNLFGVDWGDVFDLAHPCPPTC